MLPNQATGIDLSCHRRTGESARQRPEAVTDNGTGVSRAADTATVKPQVTDASRLGDRTKQPVILLIAAVNLQVFDHVPLAVKATREIQRSIEIAQLHKSAIPHISRPCRGPGDDVAAQGVCGVAIHGHQLQLVGVGDGRGVFAGQHWQRATGAAVDAAAVGIDHHPGIACGAG